MDLKELRKKEYDQRTQVNSLRRQVYSQPDPMGSADLTEKLLQAEETLAELEDQLAIAEINADPKKGSILDTEKETQLFGAETTKLEAQVQLRMAQIPTAIYHLFNPKDHPLLTCTIKSHDNEKTRRIRLSSFIEGYSATAVDTIELGTLDLHSFEQLPTLFRENIKKLNEITRASLNVEVKDLDGNVEIHQTFPIWLLARTTGYLAVKDPATKKWSDMTRYLGAFVTPNAGAIMGFLRQAAEAHPEVNLTGYQGNKDKVEPQVKALYDALQAEGIIYVNSVISFNPDDGASSQRIRLPSESLKKKQANCIDGTVLFASLLEGISMNPAIVIVPGHAFVAWETWSDSGEWRYLETTMIHDFDFAAACSSGEEKAKKYKSAKKLRQWSLKELRTEHQILPME